MNTRRIASALVLALSIVAVVRVASAQTLPTYVYVRPLYVYGPPPTTGVAPVGRAERVDARFVPADDQSDTITVFSQNAGNFGAVVGTCTTPCSLAFAPGWYLLADAHGHWIGRTMFDSGHRRYVVQGRRSRIATAVGVPIGLASMAGGLVALFVGAMQNTCLLFCEGFTGHAGDSTELGGTIAIIGGLVTAIAAGAAGSGHSPVLREESGRARERLELSRARVGFGTTGGGGVFQVGLAF